MPRANHEAHLGGSPEQLPSMTDPPRQVGPEEAIRERLRLHPQALTDDIVAMMELAGMKVSAAEVQQVMNEMKSAPA